MLSAGANAGATHGTFYLAQDTHRLYVGNEDTSISAVNEGIVTVNTIDDLPTFTTADQKRGAIGQFYYISGTGETANQNILCVYNGRGWVQINTNTNDTINSFTMAVQPEDASAGNVIQATIGDTANHVQAARFKVSGDNGVVVTYDTTQVTINGVATTVPLIEVSSKYELGVVTQSGTTKVKLKSEDGSNDTEVGFIAGQDGAGNTNVTISKDGSNDNVVIAARDTRVTGVNAAANATAGFDITLTDNYANSTVGTSSLKTNFAPKISYGNVPVTVDFVNGTATLNAYTKSEVDDLMKALNSMSYIGTYYRPGGTGVATAADQITVTGSGANKTTTVQLNNQNVPMHIGDTILVGDSFVYDGVNVSKGSLLIARGTEGTDGVITSSSLTFDIVESTIDVDTNYSFRETTGGIYLVDSVGLGTVQGGLLFTGNTVGNDSGTVTNDLIKVTATAAETVANSGKVVSTIKIEHKDVTRTDTTGTAVTQNQATSGNSWEGTTTVSVVTGVTTNASGHITGVETTQITLKDSNLRITSAVTSVESSGIYTNNGKNVGVFKQTITESNPLLSTNVTNDYAAISSKSLTIASDTQTVSSSNSAAVAALNIEMVWGSF